MLVHLTALYEQSGQRDYDEDEMKLTGTADLNLSFHVTLREVSMKVNSSGSGAARTL